MRFTRLLSLRMLAPVTWGGALIVAGMIVGAAVGYPVPYRWSSQYLSALGLIYLNGDIANFFSASLFNCSLVLAGVLSAVYFCQQAVAWGRWRCILSHAVGLLGGSGLAAIGLIPFDLHPVWHNQATYVASGALGLSILLCSLGSPPAGCRRSEETLWLLFGLFCLFFWLMLKPIAGNGPICQKLVIGFFWLYMLWHGVALQLHVRKGMS